MKFFGRGRKLRLSMHRRFGQPQGANKPCALSDYLYHRPEERIPIMDHECLNAFLTWVAYHQGSKPIEDLSCPLTGCTEKDFRDFESYLQHVFACQYLLAGKYRCSNCKREECFVPTDVKAYKFGKDSKLGDAVTSFLRQLGRKNSLNLEYGPSTDAEIPELDTDAGIRELYTDAKIAELNTDDEIRELQASAYELEVAVPEICTMERGSFVALPRELSASSTKPFELVGASRPMSLQSEIPWWRTQRPELHGDLGTSSGIELSGTRSYIDHSEGLEGESWYDDSGCDTETASVASRSSQQLNSARESWHSATASLKALQPNGAKSHSYHHHTASEDASSIGLDQCWSKPSEIGSRSAKKHGSMLLDSDSGMLRGSSRSGRTTPAGRRRTDLKLHIPPFPIETVEGLQSHEDAAPKLLASSLPLAYNRTSLVDVFSQIVEGLENLWMQKLKRSPKLSAQTSQLHSSSNFRGGLMILKRFFISNLTAPSTTKELFQFIHIAFACALKSFFEDGWYPWELFYQEVLRWSQSITEFEDRELYIQIAEYLWSALENVQPHTRPYNSNEVDMNLHMSNDVWENRVNNLGVEGPSSSQRERIPFQEAYDRLVLLSQLEGGIMIRSCTRFLDDFLCAEVFERKKLGVARTIAPREFLEGANPIVKMLLEPMLQDQRFEAFHSRVRATLGLFNDGTFINVREVEALLIAKDDLPCMTEQLYQDYVQSIQSYCDAIVASWDSSWRNRCYANCIDNIEAIHLRHRTTMVLDGDINSYAAFDADPVQHWDQKAGNDSITPTSAVTIASSGSSGSSKSSGSNGTSSTVPTSDSPASSFSSGSQRYNRISPTSVKSAVTTDLWTPLAPRKSLTTFDNNNASLNRIPPPVSPTSTSPGTTITSSPASSNNAMVSSPIDEKAHCGWCTKSFSGIRYNREYNLKRHMDDIHQQGLRFSCKEPGCRTICGRADNLRNHRLKVHGIEDPRVRPGSRKRLRKTTRRQNGTPPKTHKPSL